MSFNKY